MRVLRVVSRMEGIALYSTVGRSWRRKTTGHVDAVVLPYPFSSSLVEAWGVDSCRCDV